MSPLTQTWPFGRLTGKRSPARLGVRSIGNPETALVEAEQALAGHRFWLVGLLSSHMDLLSPRASSVRAIKECYAHAQMSSFLFGGMEG